MNEQYEEEQNFHPASETELDNADAMERGAAQPEVAWICTSRGVWHKNPFYTGKPIPHPDDCCREAAAYADQDEARERYATCYPYSGIPF